MWFKIGVGVWPGRCPVSPFVEAYDLHYDTVYWMWRGYYWKYKRRLYHVQERLLARRRLKRNSVQLKLFI